ncbi:Structure-specific endonuclease subunit SLX1 [Picochlorum sp. SENEW3]|nr:Structure-specific endonuclease subunit SLX1 [Picochlorum sp. SENEW3]
MSGATNGHDSFIGCYLLRSHHPKARWRTYIGFTVNPLRRIRQHNGELTQGAWRTKRWRPWEMVVVVYGFADQRTALQFEWTWQHAETSLDVKDACRAMRGIVRKRGADKLKGVSGQILTLFAILSTSPWKYFPLKIRFLSGEVWRMVGDVLQVVVEPDNNCLCLPEHMGVSVGALQDLECLQLQQDESNSSKYCENYTSYNDGGYDESLLEDAGVLIMTEDMDTTISSQGLAESPKKKSRKNMKIRCIFCEELAQRTWSECPGCGGRSHIGCLAEHFLRVMPPPSVGYESIGTIPRQYACLPISGSCPRCIHPVEWNDVLAMLKTAGWKRGTGENSSPQKKGKNPCKGSTSASPLKNSCKSLEDRLFSLIVDDQAPVAKRTGSDGSPPETQSLAFRVIRRLREEGRDEPFHTDENKFNGSDGCQDMIVSPLPPPTKTSEPSIQEEDHHGCPVSPIDVIDLCSPDKDVIDLVDSPE